MGVYKITDEQKTAIQANAQVIAQRNLLMQQSAFSLTADDFEHAFNPSESLAVARAAAACGYKVQRRNNFIFSITSESLGVEVVRPARISLDTEEIFAVVFTEGANTNWNAYRSGHFAPSLSLLDLAKREKLAAWVARVVRARREYYLAVNTVEQIISHLRNTGELLANWPMLATLVEDPELKRRLHNPPRVLRNYMYSPAVLQDLQARMAGSEAVINKGLMLSSNYTCKAKGVKCVRLCGFEALPSDEVWTVR